MKRADKERFKLLTGFHGMFYTGGNKARLAYADLSNYHRTLQPNGLYCVLSAAFILNLIIHIKT